MNHLLPLLERAQKLGIIGKDSLLSGILAGIDTAHTNFNSIATSLEDLAAVAERIEGRLAVLENPGDPDRNAPHAWREACPCRTCEAYAKGYRAGLRAGRTDENDETIDQALNAFDSVPESAVWADPDPDEARVTWLRARMRAARAVAYTPSKEEIAKAARAGDRAFAAWRKYIERHVP